MASLGLSLSPAPLVRAGTYDVLACDAAGGANRSWMPAEDAGMRAYTACPTNGGANRGLVVRNRIDAGRVRYRNGAHMTFSAPTGAAIAGMTFKWRGYRATGQWGVGLADGTGTHWISGCRPGVPRPTASCMLGSRDADTPPSFLALGGRRSIRIQARCGNTDGCQTAPPPGRRFGDAQVRLQLLYAAVRVQDSSAPRLSPFSGALWRRGWMRGTRAAAFNTSDNVGIRATRFYVDGAMRSDDPRACDFTRPVPCRSVSAGSYRLPTTELRDGRHRFTVESVDAAGNRSRLARDINVDNHAPARIEPLALDGGEDWRPVNAFTVRWRTPPRQFAPIATVHYRLCAVEAARRCSTGTRPGAGVEGMTLSVPGPGAYRLKVWLEDEAGNVDASNASDPVTLRFDDVPPGRAQPVEPSRWLNAAQADAYDLRVELPPAERRPVSGLRGYSVTSDGSDPDGTPESGPSGVARLPALRQGLTAVKARAVSGSGVPSHVVGSAALRVDRTPPAVAVDGAPSPAQWQRRPVHLAITGTDQAELSGMEPAPAGRPVGQGAHVAFRIGGGEPQLARGAAATATVREDGLHTVVYWAVDAAGNRSVERSVDVRVDATPPEAIRFERRSAADPRRLAATASDRTSGVAGGVIELRRRGTAPWRPLRTRIERGQLVALVDDAALPRGIYEVRARVLDAAGNEGVGDHRSDGSKMLIRVPLRTAVRLSVAFAGPDRGGNRRPIGGDARRLQVPFGARARIEGRLIGQGGRPISRAAVAVLARLRMVGAKLLPVATVTTDRNGRFSFGVEPGASRTFRFAFRGSASHLPAVDEAHLGVAASSTLRVSRSSVRNGETVAFSGQLLGRPLPRGGKLLDLQAFYRRKWRSFATVRSGASGAWSFTYRFEATYGVVTYPFRARLPREAAYPYELGYSPVVRVTVRGPAP